ncbi:MAG TPA: fluoride efflux transporter CrcB [Stellaceae bacterium]|nr:fluoride efflux transporter CrcB [Stellaceae bacterium]
MLGTYLWVAIGGALGSMARFWIAASVAEVLGPQFPYGPQMPWGTILINIVGSFVIGFFATFTGPGGRFVVSFDARAFVMVGICGGFTTFSAFSLQTLDLMRDNRWGQAGANVLISVTLCLLAVWLGHLLAAALNPAPQ